LKGKIEKTLIASVVLHILVLGWGLLSFSTKAFVMPEEETVAVDVISADQLSHVMAGLKTGKKENPKPLVEKVAEAKPPVDDAVGKITEKAPVVTDTTPPPTPKPVEKPVEKKPDPPKPVAEAKPKEEPKPVEKKPDTTDPIAEALKKEKPQKPVTKAAATTAKAEGSHLRSDQDRSTARQTRSVAPGRHRRYAQFQRGAWHRQGLFGRQFRHLGRDVPAAGRALLEKALWRNREPESGSRLLDQAEARRYAGDGSCARGYAGDALSSRLSGERASRDHRMPAV
jgi:hypothetical protein